MGPEYLPITKEHYHRVAMFRESGINILYLLLTENGLSISVKAKAYLSLIELIVEIYFDKGRLFVCVPPGKSKKQKMIIEFEHKISAIFLYFILTILFAVHFIYSRGFHKGQIIDLRFSTY